MKAKHKRARLAIAITVLFLVVGFGIMLTLRWERQRLFDPPSWNGITPGTTTRDEVISRFGQPEYTNTLSNGWEEVGYPSPVSTVLLDFVVIKNEKVLFITIPILNDDNSLLKLTKRKYGKPDLIAYSFDDQDARSYIFARAGITLLANKDTGEVTRQQMYQPMLLKEYLETIGSDIPLENPWLVAM